MLNYLSLFSGIGAPEKALTNLGIPYHLVNYCEIDKYASKSYAAVHGVSEDLNLWDVTKITKDDIKESIDLVTHGSPCQSFSISGKQEGGDEGSGTRSSLMYETLRIVGFINPKFILWENVKNVLSPRHIHNFENYRNRLDALGYNSYWKVLNAKDFGIPQNRERIFCISIRKDIDKGFEFPTPFPLTLKLKDMLDDKVDEKYYLSNDRLSGMISELNPTESIGGCDKSVNNPRLIDYCNCLTAREDRGVSNHKAEGTAVYEQNEIIKVGQLKTSYEQSGRVYDPNGISPTIMSNSHGKTTGGYIPPKIMSVENNGTGGYKVREATKKGYAEAYPGDSINLEQPNSKTRRGRVGHKVAQTLTTSCNQAVVE